MPILPATPLPASPPSPFDYKHFSSATSVVLKTVQGMLGSIVVGTVGTTPTVTLYDESTGQGLAADLIFSLSGSTAPQFINLNLWFTNGLYVVTTGSGFDILVTYI